MASTNCHLLNVDDDLSQVYDCVESVCGSWKQIGVRLGIKYGKINAIDLDERTSEDKLMRLLAAWLQIQSEDQPKPNWKTLCEAIQKVDRAKAKEIARQHQCDCEECRTAAEIRNTPVGKEVQSHNVANAARALKEEFVELISFTTKEIREADVDDLKSRITCFVMYERKVTENIKEQLERIEDIVTPSALLRYLLRHEFLGYINYALLKVMQKAIQSRLLDKHIEEYEKDYKLFLKFSLTDIHMALRECPDLQPEYPVGLPHFTIHLESDWDGRSMYEWKELFERRVRWPESLSIVKIDENCIIITYAVWPRFAEDVLQELTDLDVIADLKKEGVTINISAQLLAYQTPKCVRSSTAIEKEYTDLVRQPLTKQDDALVGKDTTDFTSEMVSSFQVSPISYPSPITQPLQEAEVVTRIPQKLGDETTSQKEMKEKTLIELELTRSQLQAEREMRKKIIVELEQTKEAFSSYRLERVLSLPPYTSSITQPLQKADVMTRIPQKPSFEPPFEITLQGEMKEKSLIELELTRSQLQAESEMKKNILVESEQTKATLKQLERPKRSSREKVITTLKAITPRFRSRRDTRFTRLMSDMERMELEIAVTCKAAFAELQVDLGEIVLEALESNQLPFQSFPTYASKIFFPHTGTDHPVLLPPRLPPAMSSEEFATLINEFREMVFDKSFLTAFITTLESQDRLTLHEKSTIASLLMVVCLQDVTYATEILLILVRDHIYHSISQTRNHPKVLLRRTESVAEKFMTNWFCVTLYPHLLETVGPPLFVLFKAVKAHLEKGPIDVMTGEAKNSLSEEKLLCRTLEFKTIECEVEVGNANHLLAKTRSHPFEPVNVGQEEIQTIKLLDTDSISQTKEKLLDFIYHNRPVSKRPCITDVELELCRGNAGIPLRDQDSTSKRDGGWTKMNTLGHYNIPEMAEAALKDPKKPTPRFRLRSRSDRPLSVPSFDVPGTIMASASVTSQTSLLGAAWTFDVSKNKIYHLVKPELEEGESTVTELFLTRLLSTKHILQPYVDNLFYAIFTIPHDKPLPKAIKVFFDFLDQIAAELNIADPDVVHIWKTNGLPLRFWVNLIKNPEFLFDINESATIDACFTVIAQAYIDACSTSEVVYTKDTPTARLLYVKEVKNYKKEVLNYYSGVQSLPCVTLEDLRLHFKETLDPLLDKLGRHEGVCFHSDSALLELYRYAVRYGDSISETLNERQLTMRAAQFNSLRQKYIH